MHTDRGPTPSNWLVVMTTTLDVILIGWLGVIRTAQEHTPSDYFGGRQTRLPSSSKMMFARSVAYMRLVRGLRRLLVENSV